MLSNLFQQSRKLRYGAWRKKRGVWNYKKKGVYPHHSKPGLIDVHLKQSLIKERTLEAANKIRELEQQSDRLFGSFDERGRFMLDRSKIP